MVEMASTSATIPVGFKQTEIGEIPDDWVIKSLIESCDYVDYRGRTPPKSNRGKILVTSRNIRKGKIDYERSKEYISESAYIECMKRGMPIIGDVLITTEAPLGMVAQVDNDAVALAQRVIKYRPKTQLLDSKFLMYILLSNSFQKQLKANTIGSTSPGIKGSILHKLLIHHPSNIDEQNVISEVLYDMDTKIQLLEKLILKRQDIKQYMMQQLLTGKTRLPGFTGEWYTTQLGKITKFIRDGTHGTHPDIENGIPLLSAKDVYNGKLHIPKDCRQIHKDEFDQIHKTFTLRNGDILITIVGTIGRVAIIENYNMNYTFQRSVGYIRLDDNQDPYFFKQLFQHSYFSNKLHSSANTSAQSGVYLGSLENIELHIPCNISEQTEIAEVLSDMDAEIFTLEKLLEKTKAIKKGMMQQLLSGRIRLVEPSTSAEDSA